MLRLILGTATKGVKIALSEININPTISATIKYQVVSHDRGIVEHEYIMSGEQYSKWGTDDTIIYHIICAKHNLQYKPYIEPQTFTEAIIYKDEQTGEMLTKMVDVPNPRYDSKKANDIFIPLELPQFEDNRSVHNMNDVAKIETLQTQLDEQQKKLKTITDLLINRGLI